MRTVKAGAGQAQHPSIGRDGRSVWRALIVLLFACSGPAAAADPGGGSGIRIDAAAKLADVSRKPHPRTVDASKVRASVDALEQEKGRKEQVRKFLSQELPAEPPMPTGTSRGERAKHEANTRRILSAEGKAIIELALEWLATRDEQALAGVRQRAQNMARWSPQGSTGYRVHDQAGRSVAWTLALAYDWLYGQWSEAERRQLEDAIKPRVAEMLSAEGPYGLDYGRKLDKNPYNSHAVSTSAQLAVVCSIMAGKDRIFDDCFREIVSRYVADPIPWGGDDGGFSQGTAYAQWGMHGTHFPVWTLLGPAIGVDLWETSYAKGYGNYIAYFLPPGTPTGMFGDDAEARYPVVWASQAKAYAANAPSPLADWYARNQKSDERESLALLLAPPRDGSRVPVELPAGVPHSVHIPSIGWVALHSRLDDSARTSVYFKSSPYGSYSHSHADQNGFVVHSRGKPLAIDSGYYDFYGSPHWKVWYKQTRAHNAITFDGGQGQAHDDLDAKGKITHFIHSGDVDIVTGDATQAYAGALNRAVRSMLFVRPGAILVFDSLSSSQPRAWEWNIHALNAMKTKGERSIEIEHQGERLCVDMLEGPDVTFRQSDRFTEEPRGKFRPQWHGTFAASSKSASAMFVALLDVGCQRPNVTVRRAGKAFEVSFAGKQFSLDESGGITQRK